MKLSNLSDQEIKLAVEHAHLLSAEDRKELEPLISEYYRRLERAEASQSFLPYVKKVWPQFIAGKHHKIMADAFERVARGECKRLIISMAPRHTKSEFASWLLPAWFLGQFPSKKIIQCSNTQDLASGFGRKVRDLINEDENYRDIFDTRLAADSQSKNHWHTTKKGEYFAIGVNGRVTGKGGDIVIIDDPHALEISTEIPTPKGFVKIGDLKIGDEVFGPDGEPVKVIAKSDVWHNRPLYRVTTDDNQTIVCDAAHLWSYGPDTKVGARYYTATTDDLTKWDKSNRPCLPRHQPVKYPHRDLPIDPWVLGAWLGDGTSSLGRMACHPDDMAYMRGEFEKAGYVTTDLADKYAFGVLKLRKQLIDQGLLENKHVPADYLTASVDQRMALLQGLMDTDGNVTTAGQCAFHSSMEHLVDSVVEILHSLGVKAKKTFYADKRKNHKPRHRVTFKLKDCARMPRKAVRTFTPTDKRRRSFDAGRLPILGSVQCITVDRPDGLFLAGRGYVVTHNSEQEAKQAERNPEIFDDVYEWYKAGPRQRLQPGGSIIVVQTRWHKRDLAGRLMKQMVENGEGVGDYWEVIELPAILDEYTEKERSMWPGFWKLEELKATRNEIGIPAWSAQYQQNPTSTVGAIIKQTDWKIWEHAKPPPCDYIIQSWDTALTKAERADYSACTTWGVFETPHPETGIMSTNVILLDAYKARMDFPTLKKRVKESYDEWQPDTLLIENKGSGISLIQELRMMGVPIEEFTPTRKKKGVSNDKVARANNAVGLFSSGFVWRPERRWAEEVAVECNEFPNGEHDDYVDSTVQALIRFRAGGFIRTEDDEDEEDDDMPIAVAGRRRYY